MLDKRIRSKELQSKIMDPIKAVKLFLLSASSIAFGGMGGQSIPKSIPDAIAKVKETENIDFSFAVFTGGATTPRFEENLSKIDVLRRYYYLSADYFREKVDQGKVQFFDYWVSEYSRSVREGTITGGNKIDVAVIEATGIEEDGGIVPSLSVDTSPAFVEACKRLIVEVNESKPVLSGLHDIYLPEHGKPINITKVLDRIGSPTIKVPKSKIAAIVINSEKEEASGSYSKVEKKDLSIAENISRFLEKEYSRDYITRENPLQFGAGPLASASMEKLSIEHLKIWSEIIPARWVESLDSKVDCISASALYTMPGEEKYLDYVFNNLELVKKHVVLRPNEVTNSMEVIMRLGVVAVQQAIEIDIFGNVNVSHIKGKIHNGVGGSGDFTRASKLTIVALPSTAANEKFSRIVPFLFNIDIPKQDVDVVVTEFGVADLRGLSPRERAEKIINISHPKFRDKLFEYYTRAKNSSSHIPFDFQAAFDFMQET